MGPAKVATRAPNDYLKKHENEPKLPKSTLSAGTNWYASLEI